MDKITSKQRSANMAAIKGKNTAPEMIVRRFLHRKGLRFRLHTAHLPGKPDLAFASRRSVVFVHGCFWHGCPHCRVGKRRVKSNTQYWNAKIARNRARHEAAVSALEASGWAVFTLWACELSSNAKLAKIERQLKRHRSPSSGSSP